MRCSALAFLTPATFTMLFLILIYSGIWFLFLPAQQFFSTAAPCRITAIGATDSSLTCWCYWHFFPTPARCPCHWFLSSSVQLTKKPATPYLTLASLSPFLLCTNCYQ